ncbi:uncharacterized protein CDAR_271511 [Caerostris darwini]|uniref:Uncharacterized protein n=1 Tax=Caerostris darwini TaxID=1538125 RepID=A0AAV4T4N8_9ARAC|nr:uncharacterized protein CDAR_271511 [Caerostris darwini]
MSDLKKTIAQIFLIALIKLILSLTEAYEDVPVLIEIPENLSLAETWKSDYEEWDYWNTTHEAELWDKNIQFNHSSWKTSSEDEILYDIYNTQPEEVLEIDEDGLELSDDWLVLDMDEEWQPDENEAEMVNDIKTSINNEENDDSISLEEQSSEVLDCDEEIPKPMKRKKKVSARKQKDDEFYFKHKKYGNIFIK